MTLLVSDVFSEAADKDLALHVPGTGSGYSKLSGQQMDVVASVSRVGKVGVSGTGLYQNETTIASADYDVSGTFQVLSSAVDPQAVCGRINGAQFDRYEAGIYLNGGNPFTEIHKFVGGVETILSSVDIFGFAAGDTMKLSMAGTSIQVLRNNVSKAAVTDASIAVIGKSGLRVTSQNSGVPALDASMSFFSVDGASASFDPLMGQICL